VKLPGSAQDPFWFKDAVIYELHVKTFFDSNNDGIGDFPGLLEKLDYLRSLGITCLWILPFFPSPLRDDGYDIADYTSVHPSYGTIDDFKAVLKAAHELGLQVMIELVINHTSDQHPWFQRARMSPPDSPERDFYVWSDSDQKYPGVRIIFTDTEKSNWTWDPVAKAYYWHRFFSHQPDLNWDNPVVVDEILRIMRFWLDMGVDGLRLDAIPYLVEREGTNCENLPETHVAIKRVRREMDEHYANRMILAEANQWPTDVREYFGDGDECHMAFHFPLMPRLFMALRLEDRHPVTEIIDQTPAIPDSCQWGLFLRNHDELTLEMVTDEERDYMYLAYSADPMMRINVGIRRRLAPLMENNRRRIELLTALLFSFPGTPILYYGDEIGMGDNIYLGDRNGVRTPMQWSTDRNAGFSRAAPAKLYSPVIMDPVYGYDAINVEAQQGDPSSLLNWTRHMIALRRLFHVFGRGSIRFLSPINRKILAYIREYKNESILCVANLSRFAQPFELELADLEGMMPIEMLGYVEFPKIGRAPYPLTLGPYGFLWFELHGTPVPSTTRTEGAGDLVLTIAAPDRWEQLLAGPSRAPIEARVLPAFLERQPWFPRQTEAPQTVRIRDWALAGSTAILLIEVDSAGTADQDIYCLPVALVPEDTIAHLGESAAIATLCPVRTGPAENRVLYDATYDPDASRALLDLLRAGATVSMRGGTLTATPAKALLEDPNPNEDLAIRRLGIEQTNTSVLFGSKFILKLFRRLRPGINPDCEVSRYLTEVIGFDGTPRFAGMLTYQAPEQPPVTLAMLQCLVEHQGDGWQATIEELGRYFESCLSHEPVADMSPEQFDHTARQLAGLYVDSAASLGRKTAELHLALATSTTDPDFSPQPFLEHEHQQLLQSLRSRATLVLESVRDNLARFPDEFLEDTGMVLGLRRRILARLAEPQTLDLSFLKIRIHGDYHLGQVLRVKQDYVIFDFEGDSSRPIEERRARQPALKDVAGMISSFGYAASSALFAYTARRPDVGRSLDPWAHAWERIVTESFLDAYLATATAAGAPFLPAAPEAIHRLLQVLVLDKTLTDLREAIASRPHWVRIPLTAILSQFAGRGGPGSSSRPGDLS
jgi:maltose alpha-D-glucosyltransferase/alpha-amylase